MPLPRYAYTGPIDHTTPPDLTTCINESVIITGGANGIGETCVREYVAAGAFVTFGDMSDRDFALQDELNAAAGGKEVCAFVKVDIRDWE
jgi:NAD(P)-dependent dehydrogenase (short-subunit alcohol dehydrogenase family)